MPVASAILVALPLLLLHRSDGGPVVVNPAQITSLRSPSGQMRMVAPTSRCIVDLTDRKFIAVIESCAEVKRQLELP